MRRIWMAALAAAVSLPTLAAAQDWNRALGALTGDQQQQDRRDSQEMRKAQDELDRIHNERAEIRSERRDIARQRGVRFVDDDTSPRRRDRMAGSSGSSSAEPWYREVEDERAALARDRRHLEDERRKLDDDRGRANKDTLGGKIDDLLGDKKR
ncbi:MAG: hypothetical protein JWM77_917 [Rhodospirillales bacterium]|nr:hypothetical protein [Rhodospirillales bacterium]